MTNINAANKKQITFFLVKTKEVLLFCSILFGGLFKISGLLLDDSFIYDKLNIKTNKI